MVTSKELRKLGIRPKILRRKLGPLLSQSMHKEIKIQKIDNIEVIPALSMNFNIARMVVRYKDDADKEDSLDVVVKHLKSDYPGTDFSRIKNKLHKEREDLVDYMRRLYEFVHGPINNGGGDKLLVKFYGRYNKEVIEEDAGKISLETVFREKTPDTNLIKRLVELMAYEHSRLAVKLPTKINELYGIRRETDFREKLHDYLNAILSYYDERLTKSEEEVVGKFFLGIDDYLNEELNPNIQMFIRLIHSDLHLGHVFLKYPGKNLEKILKMDVQDLRKETPKIKVVDVTGYSIGPQLFDLVDSIKHPVAINADEFPTSTSQRDFIEDLVELYRGKRLEGIEDSFGAEFKNGERELKRNINFLTFFKICNVDRDLRAMAKGILLRSKEENKQIYESYKKYNPKYDLYSSWYAADLGETLRYLTTNKFEKTLKDQITQDLISKFYEIIASHITEVEEDSINISRQIVNYQNS